MKPGTIVSLTTGAGFPMSADLFFIDGNVLLLVHVISG